MLVKREEALKVFEDLLGKERVLTDEKSRKEGDLLNRAYAKAHGVYATPLPIAILNVQNKEEISKF